MAADKVAEPAAPSTAAATPQADFPDQLKQDFEALKKQAAALEERLTAAPLHSQSRLLSG